MALHNNTSIFIANAQFKERNIMVSVSPFALEDTANRSWNGGSSKEHGE